MADLSARIEAAIRERLTVARAATTGTGRWLVTRMAPYTDPLILVEMDESGETLQTVGTIDVEVDVQLHVSVSDPADAILGLEHALGILERHPENEGRCVTCMEWCECPGTALVDDCPCRGNIPWPCDEIKALAARYGVEIDDPSTNQRGDQGAGSHG